MISSHSSSFERIQLVCSEDVSIRILFSEGELREDVDLAESCAMIALAVKAFLSSTCSSSQMKKRSLIPWYAVPLWGLVLQFGKLLLQILLLCGESFVLSVPASKASQHSGRSRQKYPMHARPRIDGTNSVQMGTVPD